MRIVFMGTPDFAVPSLQILIDKGYKPVAVVTGEDKAKGRGRKVQTTPIKQLALEHDIPLIQPRSVKSESFAQDVRDAKPDLIIVVAFRILPEAVFSIPSLGSFNLHGSVLPAFRGAAPINRAIMQGVDRTGLTTFFLQAKVDTGNIIATCETEVGPNESAGVVHDRLKDMGADLVLKTVMMIEDGGVEVSAQDNSLATPAPKIFRADCRIQWDKSAQEVHNHIRGLSPRPTAYSELEETPYKFYESRVSDRKFKGEPGEVDVEEGRLFINCGEGLVEILEIQKPGKKRQQTADFLRGTSLATGSIFS